MMGIFGATRLVEYNISCMRRADEKMETGKVDDGVKQTGKVNRVANRSLFRFITSTPITFPAFLFC